MGTQHDTDFYAWSQEQAALLRAGQLSSVDVANVAEEIEDMGKEQRNAIRSLLRILLVHLLKLRYSLSADPRAGWIEELAEFRAQLEDRLEDNPSLRPQLPELYGAAWKTARRAAQAALAAHGEDVNIPAECPFSLPRAMDPDFLG